MLLRLGPFFAGERGVAQAQFELLEQLGRRQISFKPIMFLASSINHQHRRSPDCPETVGAIRLLVEVDADRDKIRGDVAADLRIRINLGLQPGAGLSMRRGANVDQHQAVLLFGLRQRAVNIFLPGNLHADLGEETNITRRKTAAPALLEG